MKIPEEFINNLRGLLRNYLTVFEGVDISRNFRCLNPEHTHDVHPSMSYDRERNKVHCFTCNADWDIFDLVGMKIGSTNFRICAKEICRMFNIPFPYDEEPLQENQNRPSLNQPEQNKPTSKKIVQDFSDYIRTCHRNVGATDYWKRRGLSQETIDRFMLGYDPHYNRQGCNNWEVAIIPKGKYGYSARNVNPNAAKDVRYRKEGEQGIYNLDVMSGDAPVFLCEGEIDALSIMDLGYSAIAYGTADRFHVLSDYIKVNHPKYPIIIALDNDETGNKTSEKLKKQLQELPVPVLSIRLDLACMGVKDPNEALIKDRVFFSNVLADFCAMAMDYEKDMYVTKACTSSYVDTFLEEISSKIGHEIPTGFGQLDKALDGGLYQGLYVVGAISSLGKTTYVLQIADSIASNGQDVLVFSYEQNRSELVAKSLSRLTSVISMEKTGKAIHAKTTRAILNGKMHNSYTEEDKVAYNESLRQYREISKHLFMFQTVPEDEKQCMTVDFISQKVRDHIRITGRVPVVIVDYLQIMPTQDYHATDKQNIDKNVLGLKTICNAYHTPVIAVSSLNRENYKERISMQAYKESGSIEYASDVLLGMQLTGVERKDFDVDKAKTATPRAIDVVVLKNRNGATGKKIAYDYYPAYNYFVEHK